LSVRATAQHRAPLRAARCDMTPRQAAAIAEPLLPHAHKKTRRLPAG
jgi:hypothetical protein